MCAQADRPSSVVASTVIKKGGMFCCGISSEQTVKVYGDDGPSAKIALSCSTLMGMRRTSSFFGVHPLSLRVGNTAVALPPVVAAGMPVQVSKQAAEAGADKAISELADIRDFLGSLAGTFALR